MGLVAGYGVIKLMANSQSSYSNAVAPVLPVAGTDAQFSVHGDGVACGGGSVLPGMFTSPANAETVSIDTQRASGSIRFIVSNLSEVFDSYDLNGIRQKSRYDNRRSHTCLVID